MATRSMTGTGAPSMWSHRAPCGKCGYSLQGSNSPTCPECGADCREPERPDGPKKIRLPIVPGWYVALPIAIVLLVLVVVVLVLRPIG